MEQGHVQTDPALDGNRWPLMHSKGRSTEAAEEVTQGADADRSDATVR